MKGKIKFKNIIIYSLLILGSVIMVYPFIYAVMGGICTPKEFYETGLFPRPKEFTASRLNIFLMMFSDKNAQNILGCTFWESLGFTVGRIAYYAFFTVFTSMLLGYLFAKVNFKGKRFWFMFFMVSMMVPGVATIVPLYIVLARFPLIGGNDIIGDGGHGFINEWPVMFITGLFGIYNVFLVRQSVSSLSDEYREAAEVDGAGFFRTVFSIYMPMVAPILSVLLIGLVIGHWNDYFFSRVYASGPFVIKPVGYYVATLISSFELQGDIYKEYPTMLGISAVFMLPPVIFYAFAQKRFVTGFSIGGLKE